MAWSEGGKREWVTVMTTYFKHCFFLSGCSDGLDFGDSGSTPLSIGVRSCHLNLLRRQSENCCTILYATQTRGT